MFSKISSKETVLLLIIVCIAFLSKLFYAVWGYQFVYPLIYLTSLGVELFTGMVFSYIPDVGFLNSDKSVLINENCAGLNFFVIVSILTGFSLVFAQIKSGSLKFWSLLIPLSLLLTICANVSRISVAILLKSSGFNSGTLSTSMFHEVQGGVVYLFFLISWYFLIQNLLFKNRMLHEKPA